MAAIDVVRSELIQTYLYLNCSQDGQPGHSFLGQKCFSLIL